MIQRRALLATLAMPAIARAQGSVGGRSTLRFVPSANLSILDPTFTTQKVTANHAYHVFDTLYAVDSSYTPRPQMAEGHTVSDDGRVWRITLRPGLVFHDGQPVLARDCIASLQRWAKRDGFGQLLAERVAEWSAPNDRTLEVRLQRPFPRLLDAIGKPSSYVPFIMPGRLATQDAAKPVTEMVGSGPYRFAADEYLSGARAVYVRHDGYVPRAEPPDWAAGGKVPRFDRVEWQVIPDPATAVAALANNEVDWVEQPLADLLPRLRRDPRVVVGEGDATGYLAIARMNHLQPPFNDKRVRQAMMAAIDQADHMQALVGDEPGAWRRCASLFGCGGPYESVGGTESLMAPPRLDEAKRLLAASGYAGQRVVILNPADVATIAPLGRVTAAVLRAIGMTVDLQEQDFGTVASRLQVREPVERGGWSIYHTWWPGSSIATPPGNALVRGLGPRGWVGWYASDAAEGAVADWLDAADDAARIGAARRVQAIAGADVATVPLGQFSVPTAWRRELTGIVPGPGSFPWGARRA